MEYSNRSAGAESRHRCPSGCHPIARSRHVGRSPRSVELGSEFETSRSCTCEDLPGSTLYRGSLHCSGGYSAIVVAIVVPLCSGLN